MEPKLLCKLVPARSRRTGLTSFDSLRLQKPKRERHWYVREQDHKKDITLEKCLKESLFSSYIFKVNRLQIFLVARSFAAAQIKAAMLKTEKAWGAKFFAPHSSLNFIRLLRVVFSCHDQQLLRQEMPTSGDLKSGDCPFFTSPPEFQRHPPEKLTQPPMGMT